MTVGVVAVIASSRLCAPPFGCAGRRISSNFGSIAFASLSIKIERKLACSGAADHHRAASARRRREQPCARRPTQGLAYSVLCPARQFIDIELRSLQALRRCSRSPDRKMIRRIISFHDFNSTPALRTLRAKARRGEIVRRAIFSNSQPAPIHSAQLDALDRFSFE